MLQADKTALRAARALDGLARGGRFADSGSAEAELGDLIGHRATLPVLRDAIGAVLPPAGDCDPAWSIAQCPLWQIDRARIAAEGLAKFGPGANETVPLLTRLALADDIALAAAAIGALEGIGSPRAIDALFATLSNSDILPDMEYCALESITRLGWRSALFIEPLQLWYEGLDRNDSIFELATRRYGDILRAGRRHYQAFMEGGHPDKFVDARCLVRLAAEDGHPVRLPFSFAGKHFEVSRIQFRTEGRNIDFGVIGIRGRDERPVIVINLDRWSFGLESRAELNASVLFAAARSMGCDPQKCRFILRQAPEHLLIVSHNLTVSANGFSEIITRPRGTQIEIKCHTVLSAYASIEDCGISRRVCDNHVPESYRNFTVQVLSGRSEAILRAPEVSKVRFKEMSPVAEAAHHEVERIANRLPGVESGAAPISWYFPVNRPLIPTTLEWISDPVVCTVRTIKNLLRGAPKDESLHLYFKKIAGTNGLQSSEPPNHVLDASSVGWGQKATPSQRDAMATFILSRLIEPMDDRLIPVSVKVLGRGGVIEEPCSRLSVVLARDFAGKFLMKGSSTELSLSTRTITIWLLKSLSKYVGTIDNYYLGSNFRRLGVE